VPAGQLALVLAACALGATVLRVVAVAPFTLGLPAGDRLRPHVTLISEHASCAEVRARAHRGWVVIVDVASGPVPGHPGLQFVPSWTAGACLAGRRRRTSGLASGCTARGGACCVCPRRDDT
jgi:hypothetical protein